MAQLWPASDELVVGGAYRIQLMYKTKRRARIENHQHRLTQRTERRGDLLKRVKTTQSKRGTSTTSAASLSFPSSTIVLRTSLRGAASSSARGSGRGGSALGALGGLALFCTRRTCAGIYTAKREASLPRRRR